MILEKEEDKEEDFDFDFSIYEQEDKVSNELTTIQQEKPEITGLRSKYSPSVQELEAICEIKNKVSEYAIKVAAYSNDNTDLWKMYGSLNEYWARIHDIYGKRIINEINIIKFRCEKLLRKNDKEGIKDYNTHKMLLFLRDKIYMIAQRSNLGLDVERAASSMSKAKSGIIQ